jgi:hypothetical protein
VQLQQARTRPSIAAAPRRQAPRLPQAAPQRHRRRPDGRRVKIDRWSRRIVEATSFPPSSAASTTRPRLRIGELERRADARRHAVDQQEVAEGHPQGRRLIDVEVTKIDGQTRP